MNANDLRLFQTLERYCEDLQLEIDLSGDSFVLMEQVSGLNCGRFSNIESLSNYIYGYEAGLSKGKCQCK